MFYGDLLSPAMRWVCVCRVSGWGFLLWLFLRRLRFYTAWPTAAYPSVVMQLFWLRLPVLLLRWWSKLGSRLSLWVVSASPAPAGLPMIAGCRTLWGWFCHKGCDGCVVVSSGTTSIFRTFLVVMSWFAFIPSCASLGVVLCASSLVGSPPVFVGVPLPWCSIAV